MKEWRRTLRSWPRETLAIADLASLPPWVGEAARVRRETRGSKGRARLAVALILVATLAFLLFMDSLPVGDPHFLGVMLGLFATVPLAVVLGAERVERRAIRHRDREIDRLETLGEATLGGDFVGVAYADRGWTYPGLGKTVDEGILRIDLDRLTFIGRHTRFELPARAIVSTEIRRHDPGTGERGLLYVSWSEGGEAGTLSLSLPYRRSARRRVAEMADLRERLERWRVERFPQRARPSGLPPVFAPTKKDNPYERVGRPAKLLAGGALFAAFLVPQVAFEFWLGFGGRQALGHHHSGIFGGLYPLGMGLWLALAAKIEPRLPARWRYQEPKTIAEVPNLGEARILNEPDSLSLGQRSGL